MSDISINFLSRASDVSDPLGGEIASKSPYTKEEERFVAVTHVDWKETRDAHVFKADLPGVKKEAVKLGVIDGRILEISADGSKEELKVWEGERYHRSERPQIRFLRRFRLPENAKVDEAKAVMDNGLLTVTVPKRPQPKPQFKAIEISG